MMNDLFKSVIFHSYVKKHSGKKTTHTKKTQRTLFGGCIYLCEQFLIASYLIKRHIFGVYGISWYIIGILHPEDDIPRKIWDCAWAAWSSLQTTSNRLKPQTGLRYCMPSNADTVLCIDPDKQQMMTIGGPLEGDWKWHGGNLGDVLWLQRSNSVIAVEEFMPLGIEHPALSNWGWQHLWHPCKCHAGLWWDVMDTHLGNVDQLTTRCLAWGLQCWESTKLSCQWNPSGCQQQRRVNNAPKKRTARAQMWVSMLWYDHSPAGALNWYKLQHACAGVFHARAHTQTHIFYTYNTYM